MHCHAMQWGCLTKIPIIASSKHLPMRALVSGDDRVRWPNRVAAIEAEFHLFDAIFHQMVFSSHASMGYGISTMPYHSIVWVRVQSASHAFTGNWKKTKKIHANYSKEKSIHCKCKITRALPRLHLKTHFPRATIAIVNGLFKTFQMGI